MNFMQQQVEPQEATQQQLNHCSPMERDIIEGEESASLCDETEINDSEGLRDDSSTSSDSANPDGPLVNSATVLQAVISCAHYLNYKDLTKLVGVLQRNIRLDGSNFDAVDENGNTFLHLICETHETTFFPAGRQLAFIIACQK